MRSPKLPVVHKPEGVLLLSVVPAYNKYRTQAIPYVESFVILSQFIASFQKSIYWRSCTAGLPKEETNKKKKNTTDLAGFVPACRSPHRYKSMPMHSKAAWPKWFGIKQLQRMVTAAMDENAKKNHSSGKYKLHEPHFRVSANDMFVWFRYQHFSFSYKIANLQTFFVTKLPQVKVPRWRC